MLKLFQKKKLVQKWRFKDWPKDYYSTVEINFEPKDGRTHLTLKHKDVIPSSKDLAKEGWQRNYFTGIKGCFGYEKQNANKTIPYLGGALFVSVILIGSFFIRRIYY